MNPTERLVWTYGSILFLLGVWLSVFNTVYFDTVYAYEDGLLEWLTVVSLGTTAVVCIRRAIRHHRRYDLTKLLGVCGASFIFLFGMGEELSWAQRLFAIPSTDFFQTNNSQSELNLHNLVVGGKNLNKILFARAMAAGLAVYLFVFTPLWVRTAWMRNLADRLAVPIPTRRQWWGFLAVVIVAEGLQPFASTAARRGELTEFSLTALIMLTVLFPRNISTFEPELDPRSSQIVMPRANALQNGSAAHDVRTAA